MYGIERRTWIAMGDPVGKRDESAELVWRFREAAHQHGARAVFYQIATDYLPLYVDAGYALLRIGEEARVPLATFSLEGGERKGLRRTRRHLLAEGAVVEIIPAERVPPLLGELKAISDAWLAEKRTREKGFSLGRFDPEYLRRFPMALVRVQGRIVAFANIWTAGRAELSIDLMRHLPDSPDGTMEFLLMELMLWGRQEAFAWFNLGMAPLAGLVNRQLAPLWHRAGAVLYGHGAAFYNFQGLRIFKSKFDPVWEPRYLAYTGGSFALPGILTNVASLIGGGVRGVLSR
jgi:phosphatidylglycerol lysyltransferase